MEMTFPCKEIDINGEPHIHMNLEHFYSLFTVLFETSGIHREEINYVKRNWDKIKKIKKQRIRLKKQKQLAIYMLTLLLEKRGQSHGA
jgi:uncharacterized protein with ParB-like and HNH nuclease domain